MIDMERLMEFCDGDAELAMSFLEMFKKEARIALNAIPEMRREERWDELSNLAHKMKSQCLYVGVAGLASVAEALEHKADQRESVDVDELIPEFYKGMNEVLNSF